MELDMTNANEQSVVMKTNVEIKKSSLFNNLLKEKRKLRNLEAEMFSKAQLEWKPSNFIAWLKYEFDNKPQQIMKMETLFKTIMKCDTTSEISKCFTDLAPKNECQIQDEALIFKLKYAFANLSSCWIDQNEMID
jgi:hypothetical protein